MKIYFYPSEKQREKDLAKAFCWGAILNGYDAQVRSDFDGLDLPDIACMVGVKSKELWNLCKLADVTTVMFDKGYSRHKLNGCWEYWRVSLGRHSPLETLTDLTYSKDRFNSLGVKVRPWRWKGNHILIAGSSEKYHNFHRLEHPGKYYPKLVKQLKKRSNRPVVYRPKPSYRGSSKIKGAGYSKDRYKPIKDDLINCHALITHGSNSCYEAAISGVPSIVLGGGVMRAESSLSIDDIELPRLGTRLPLFYGLAYHQWTLEEMASGEMFETFKRWL